MQSNRGITQYGFSEGKELALVQIRRWKVFRLTAGDLYATVLARAIAELDRHFAAHALGVDRIHLRIFADLDTFSK